MLAFSLAAAPCAWAADHYEGLAYAAQSGELAYREIHWRYEEQGQPARLVLYRCPNGAAFARKRMSAGSDPATPNFDFIDARTGYREGVRGAGDRREVYWRAGHGGDMKTRTLELDADAVIDAGFDAVVRAQWQALREGTSIEAGFLLPSRLEFIDVSIGRIDGAKAETTRLRMELDAWYGFAAPRTELVYRNSDRWLLQFEGIGSIRDDSGHHQEVRIEFPPALRTADIDRKQVDAAVATPLGRSCNG